MTPLEWMLVILMTSTAGCAALWLTGYLMVLGHNRASGGCRYFNRGFDTLAEHCSRCEGPAG